MYCRVCMSCWLRWYLSCTATIKLSFTLVNWRTFGELCKFPVMLLCSRYCGMVSGWMEMNWVYISSEPLHTLAAIHVAATVHLNWLAKLLCYLSQSLWVLYIFQNTTFAFSARTLLVRRQEGHPACKSWVVRCWHGYLSGARCKWSASGPADATVNPSSFASLKSRMVYLSGAGLPQVVLEKKPFNGCMSVCVLDGTS